MKVLVAYKSKTGNTRKVAEAIYGEINYEKEIKTIDQVDTIEGYDVTFLGFPIEKEGPSKQATQFLEKHCGNGGKIVLFITHAAQEDSPELQPMLDKFTQAASGAKILDMFDCQGQLAKSVKMIMSVMPNAKYRRWAKLDNSQGQPDQTRIERARTFSRDVMRRMHEEEGQLERLTEYLPEPAVA
jgi:flavodoxin